MEQLGDTARARYCAVLFDFGGVLTTSVLASLEEFGRKLGDPRLVLRVLAEDEGGGAVLKAHEIGEIDQAARSVCCRTRSVMTATPDSTSRRCSTR